MNKAKTVLSVKKIDNEIIFTIVDKEKYASFFKDNPEDAEMPTYFDFTKYKHNFYDR
ncbi:MAG: hypothetical protein LC122_11900 [Chitinophagales bacterium]|nr:hypothetical protein [Chitinophagales bacterium]